MIKPKDEFQLLVFFGKNAYMESTQIDEYLQFSENWIKQQKNPNLKEEEEEEEEEGEPAQNEKMDKKEEK